MLNPFFKLKNLMWNNKKKNGIGVVSHLASPKTLKAQRGEF